MSHGYGLNGHNPDLHIIWSNFICIWSFGVTTYYSNLSAFVIMVPTYICLLMRVTWPLTLIDISWTWRTPFGSTMFGDLGHFKPDFAGHTVIGTFLKKRLCIWKFYSFEWKYQDWWHIFKKCKISYFGVKVFHNL